MVPMVRVLAFIDKDGTVTRQSTVELFDSRSSISEYHHRDYDLAVISIIAPTENEAWSMLANRTAPVTALLKMGLLYGSSKWNNEHPYTQ